VRAAKLEELYIATALLLGAEFETTSGGWHRCILPDGSTTRSTYGKWRAANDYLYECGYWMTPDGELNKFPF